MSRPLKLVSCGLHFHFIYGLLCRQQAGNGPVQETDPASMNIEDPMNDREVSLNRLRETGHAVLNATVTNRGPEFSHMRISPVASRIWLTVVLAAVLASAHIAVPPSVNAQEALSEYQVKAAYLFNFLKFVQWPDDAFADSLAPIVIGIVGDDPFGNALPEVVIGKTIRGRDLVIRKYRMGENLRGASILFISASEKKRLAQILAGLRGSSALTVADMDGFLDAGGMIQFLSENDRVRFAINVVATSQAKLKVSSKLLSLAHVVGKNLEESKN